MTSRMPRGAKTRIPEHLEREMANGRVPTKVKLTLASDVITKPVRWLWDKRIPKGKLTMFDGDPDVGKSIVTMDLAARVSVGRTFPDGTPCEPGNVLIVNVEDAKDDTIVPRLQAHGADLERIAIIDGMPDEELGTRLLDLPADVPALRVAVEEHDTTLLIIDPVITMLEGDAYKDRDARRALTPLRDMAEETGVTVVAVRHLNKNTSLSAIQRGGGNMGLIGVARAGAFFAHHPDVDGFRVMAHHKANLAEKQPSLQYVIRGWAIDSNIGRVEWKGATEHDANSLASASTSPAEKTKQDEAMEFLRDELADGPEWAKIIYRDADAAGISKGTLLIAKSTLRVRSEKIGTEGWQWSLPEGTKHRHPFDSLEPLEPLEPSDPRTTSGDSQSAYIKEGTKDVKGAKIPEGANLPLSANEGNSARRSPQELREIADELTSLMRKRKLKSARAKELKAILVEAGECGTGVAAPLSADEGNARVQELIDQGMKPEFAAEEMMKRMREGG